MHQEEGGLMALWKMPSWTAEPLGLTMELKQLVVPLTNGVSARSEDADALVVCFVMVRWRAVRTPFFYG